MPEVDSRFTLYRKVWFGSDHSRAQEQSRMPRVSRLLALAIHYDQLLQAGHVRDHEELSRLANVSRRRLRQIMNLRLLAPDVQEAILFMNCRAHRDPFSERDLRPIVAEIHWSRQRTMWAQLQKRNGLQ